MRDNNSEVLEIVLTESHLNAIHALKLGIHPSNAKHAIDCLVNSANIEQRLSIDDAVKQFCKNQQTAYESWVTQLKTYAEAHGISIKSAVSVFNDRAAVQLRSLYWPSGFHNDAIMKLETEL